MACSGEWTNVVNELVARSSQTTVQGLFWRQGLDPMGFAILCHFMAGSLPDPQ